MSSRQSRSLAIKNAVCRPNTTTCTSSSDFIGGTLSLACLLSVRYRSQLGRYRLPLSSQTCVDCVRECQEQNLSLWRPCCLFWLTSKTETPHQSQQSCSSFMSHIYNLWCSILSLSHLCLSSGQVRFRKQVTCSQTILTSQSVQKLSQLRNLETLIKEVLSFQTASSAWSCDARGLKAKKEWRKVPTAAILDRQ